MLLLALMEEKSLEGCAFLKNRLKKNGHFSTWSECQLFHDDPVLWFFDSAVLIAGGHYAILFVVLGGAIWYKTFAGQ